MDLTPNPHTAFHYLYRDGSNWKSFGTLVLRGSLEEGLRQRLIAALEDDQYFVPSPIDVPPVYPWTEGKWPASEEDHSYHEFVELEPTTEPATDERTLRAFVEAVEAAGRGGWVAFDPFEHQARHLPAVIAAARRPDWGAYARGAARVGYFHPDVDWAGADVDWRTMFEELVATSPVRAARLLARGPDVCLGSFGEDDVVALLTHDDRAVRQEAQFAAARVLPDLSDPSALPGPSR